MTGSVLATRTRRWSSKVKEFGARVDLLDVRRLDSLLPQSSARLGEETPRSQRKPSELQVYSQESSYVIAAVGRCLIHIVRDRTTATTLSLMRRASAELAESYPTFGYLAILENGAQIMMPPDIRDGVNAFVRRYSSRFTGVAVVFEKTGFHGTALLSVVTAINFASQAKHASEVFTSVPDAALWLSRRTPGELTPTRLIQVANQLRSPAP